MSDRKSMNVKTKGQNHADLLIWYQKNFPYESVPQKQSTKHSGLKLENIYYDRKFVKKNQICCRSSWFWLIMHLPTQHFQWSGSWPKGKYQYWNINHTHLICPIWLHVTKCIILNQRNSECDYRAEMTSRKYYVHQKCCQAWQMLKYVYN
jgi:hypothetical protein